MLVRIKENIFIPTKQKKELFEQPQISLKIVSYPKKKKNVYIGACNRWEFQASTFIFNLISVIKIKNQVKNNKNRYALIFQIFRSFFPIFSRYKENYNQNAIRPVKIKFSYQKWSTTRKEMYTSYRNPIDSSLRS